MRREVRGASEREASSLETGVKGPGKELVSNEHDLNKPLGPGLTSR